MSIIFRSDKRSAARVRWYHAECLFRGFGRTKSTTNTVREVAHLDGFGQLLPDDKGTITDVLTSWVTMSPLQEAKEEVGEEVEIEKLDDDPQCPSNSAMTGEALDFLIEASEADSGPMPLF